MSLTTTTAGRGAALRVAETSRTTPALEQGPHKDLLNYQVITNSADLREMVRRYSDTTTIALDIETSANAGFGSTRGAIRLIQLGVDDEQHGREQVVVDCFAVDPTPLFSLLQDPDREILIHYAPFEQEWFAYHHGVWMPNIFDTCGAWQAIHRKRLADDPDYGKRPASLKAVVEEITGEPMAKEEQASFWGRPELMTSQIEYAALDVAILKMVADAAKAEAANLGIEDGVVRANRAVRGRVEGALTRIRRDRSKTDEAALLNMAMHYSQTLGELERSWRFGRQIAMSHASRTELRQIYLARRAELSGARAAA